MSTWYTVKENLEKSGKGEPWAPAISVRISPRMHKILQAECDRRGEGMSAVIRRHLVDASHQSTEHFVLERVERKIDVLTSLGPGSGGALAGTVDEIASTTFEIKSRLAGSSYGRVGPRPCPAANPSDPPKIGSNDAR